MSRDAQLPPRGPFQKKLSSQSNHKTISPPFHTESYMEYPQHHKSFSQSSILEENPAWLDGLLKDPDAKSSGISLRRSASDSLTFLNDLMDSFPVLTLHDDQEDSIDCETGTGLESACMYGPNSPRKKGHLIYSGNALVSALSESISQDPWQHVDGNPTFHGITCSNSKVDGSVPVGDHTAETKTAKRRSGQHSRVRKLQYIAELERTVNSLQTFISELATRVSSLHQRCVTLSMENGELQNQLVTLQQEKLMLEGQHQLLKKEAERLSIRLVNSPNYELEACFEPSASTRPAVSEFTWQMLDMSKLDLT
ncbi:hypothetical protein SLEP1_g47455 [Rubroshorea leprosula]|uniref:BZIP domain-containing protein n=1 Tax=Rubroshorea leprosula TaxID=152421 RepID=A0AAV5LSA2_9ROSI|nr:hypothetical protein SLEP1_g47455 [Rubroshorea leprosula]